jgi:YD repeat-containing protein
VNRHAITTQWATCKASRIRTGVTHAYSYDQLNRLTQMGSSKNATALSNYAYTLGAAGNHQSVAELSGRNVAYGYDALYRLTSETVTADPHNHNVTNGYTYDAVGNRQPGAPHIRVRCECVGAAWVKSHWVTMSVPSETLTVSSRGGYGNFRHIPLAAEPTHRKVRDVWGTRRLRLAAIHQDLWPTKGKAL